MINIIFICDGTSDFCLVRVIEWLMGAHFDSVDYRVIQAQGCVPARGALDDRLSRSARMYSGDLIVCHRDAERDGLNARADEISNAAAGVGLPVVPMVPVRMSEAWLLFDESAIRSAANNANGRMPLNIPRPRDLESIVDPKNILHNLLCEASGLSGQRLRRFNSHSAVHRVASYISDFGGLRVLESFRTFEADFVAQINTLL